MKDNVFEIANPGDYSCEIRRFNIGHSKMFVQVRNKEGFFYIVFSAVEYFSGAIRWKGANFSMKPDEEAISILRKVERFKNMPDEKLLKLPAYHLYEVETSNDIIQIVAPFASVQSRMDPAIPP